MRSKSSIAPFVAPFVVFMLFLGIVDASFPGEHYLLYPVKSLLVAGVIAWYWRELPSLKPAAPLASVAVGIVGLVLWVGMEPFSNLLADVLGGFWNQAVSAMGWTSWEMKTAAQPAPGWTRSRFIRRRRPGRCLPAAWRGSRWSCR
jgi:hypothetical protein